jgi:hypothetical protein
MVFAGLAPNHTWMAWPSIHLQNWFSESDIRLSITWVIPCDSVREFRNPHFTLDSDFMDADSNLAPRLVFGEI